MRKKWIDFLKAIAMVAVIQNHLPSEARLYEVLYSIFSVSLFILLGGITSAISLQDQDSFEYKDYLIKKLKKIFIPYLVATCGYTVFDLGYLDIFYMLKKLLTFSSGSLGHMYFVCFYLQLVIIAPLLVKLYKNCEKSEFLQGFLLVCSAALSYLFQHYTYLDGFLLGSRFLFGGSYFFLFNLGIYFCFHINWIDTISARLTGILISLGGLIYMIYRQWYTVWWTNPPSIKTIIYTIAVFTFIYCSITLIQKAIKKPKTEHMFLPLAEIFCFAGKYSLHIYFWHVMLIDLIAKTDLYSKSASAWGLKLAINCFILYFPCSVYLAYRKIANQLQKLLCH